MEYLVVSSLLLVLQPCKCLTYNEILYIIKSHGLNTSPNTVTLTGLDLIQLFPPRTMHLYCPLSSLLMLWMVKRLLSIPVARDGIFLCHFLIHRYVRLSAPPTPHVTMKSCPTATT